jgi:hypothetical protein
LSARLGVVALTSIWMAGTILVAIVATQNFWTIDRLLQSSPNESFRHAVETVGHEQVREVLRYLSSELNRLYFQYWNLVQIAIGILALWLNGKAPANSKVKWAIVSMLGVVLVMTAWITPQMVSVGRRLDFVPRDPVPPELRTFGLLHAAYTLMDVVVLILGMAAIVWLVKQPEPDRIKNR